MSLLDYLVRDLSKRSSCDITLLKKFHHLQCSGGKSCHVAIAIKNAARSGYKIEHTITGRRARMYGDNDSDDDVEITGEKSLDEKLRDRLENARRNNNFIDIASPQASPFKRNVHVIDDDGDGDDDYHQKRARLVDDRLVDDRLNDREEAELSSLANLPYEMLVKISLHLPLSSIGKYCGLSRRFSEICNDKYVWTMRATENKLVWDTPINTFTDYTYLLKICKRIYKDKFINEQVEWDGMTQNEKDDALVLASGKHFANVRLLLENGANVNALNGSPLINASRYHQLGIVEFLLRNNANIHAQNDKALTEAIKHGHFRVVDFLLAHGAHVRAQDDLALILASHLGHADIVSLLLEKGADVRARNDKALIEASHKGYLEVVTLLLERGAYVHARNDKALVEASAKGHLEVVDALLQNGAHVNARDDSALIEAIRNDHYWVVAYLLRNGANARTQDDIALTVASYTGQYEIVQLLLEYGANIRHDTLILASRKGQARVVELLLKHGANVHIQDDEALIDASTNGHLDVVRVLLKHGADIHAQHDAALISARNSGNIDLVELLSSASSSTSHSGCIVS